MTNETVTGEVLDAEPRLAQPRWTVEDGHLCLPGGEPYDISDLPEKIQEAVGQLPQDYLELGKAAADAKAETRMALRLQDAAEQQLDEAEDRLRQFERVEGSDNKEKALATLTYDLEAACNLLIRISVALGIQPGGEFYENIKNLVEKYGMEMRYAKDYSYDNLVAPGPGRPPEITVQEERDTGPATITIGDDGRVVLKPLLDPGDTEFPELPESTEPVDEESRDWLKDE